MVEKKVAKVIQPVAKRDDIAQIPPILAKRKRLANGTVVYAGHKNVHMQTSTSANPLCSLKYPELDYAIWVDPIFLEVKDVDVLIFSSTFLYSSNNVLLIASNLSFFADSIITEGFTVNNSKSLFS